MAEVNTTGKIGDAVVGVLSGSTAGAIAKGVLLVLSPIVLWVLYKVIKKIYRDYKIAAARKEENKKIKEDFENNVIENQEESSQVVSDENKLEDKIAKRKEARKK